MVILGACGGGSSDELVRLHFENTLDFRMDSSDGPEHIVRFDETIAINRDGSGTRTSAAFDGTRTFQVSEAAERRLSHALAALDLGLVAQRFGTQKQGDGTTTLTYNGQTITTADERVRGPGPGGKGELAEHYLAITSAIEGLSGETIPEPSPSAQRVLHRTNRQLQRTAHPTCEHANELIRRMHGLDRRERRRLYSQVRDSDQPCP